MEKLEFICYKNKDININIKISVVENIAWFTIYDFVAIFKRNRSSIIRQIKQVLSTSNNPNSVCANFATTGPDGKTYLYKNYNQEVLKLLSNKLGLKIGFEIYDFVIEYLRTKKAPYNQNERIIIFNNGRIDIPINIDFKEENAWASVRQMAKLFDTSIDNIYLHIKNIFSEGELDCFEVNSVYEDSSVTDLKLRENIVAEKEILLLAEDGKYYSTKVYNLDVILAVGYRVKSVIAMRFRRWVSFVLKKILMSGYYLDEEKCEHCNKVLELKNKVLELKNEQLKEIRYYPGDQFRGFIEVKRFLETAKHEILIIDNYFGHEFDDVLININVKKTIITSPKNSKIETNNNYKVIKTDYYHDRYIFVDNLCYTFGASIKDIGIHESTARRMLGFSIKDVYKNVGASYE